jgi:excisionase family DNA binding protein
VGHLPDDEAARKRADTAKATSGRKPGAFRRNKSRSSAAYPAITTSHLNYPIPPTARNRMSSKVYLTPREAAEYLRSSTSTLAKRRVYGGGPTFCRLGRAIRYRQSDIDEFMTRNSARSTSEPRPAE